MATKPKKLWRWIVGKAEWSTSYINDLPDSSFLYIEDGGEKDDDGKTVPRKLRHLPYKDADGTVDEGHLDNAIARLSQDDTGAGEDAWLTDSLRETLLDKAKAAKSKLSKADDTDAGAAFGAAVAAYQVKLDEMGLEIPDGGFSCNVIADSDGDADLDGSSLLCVYDANASWYVVVNGGQADVVAFYLYRPIPGYYDDYDCFCCSADIAKSVEASDRPGGTDHERDQLILHALSRADSDQERYLVVKSDSTQRYTLGVAYPADSVDAHGDFTDSVELEKAAWQFMRDVIAKGESGAGLDHADDTDGAAVIVESYIYRGPDWTIQLGDGETQVVKSGDWMLGAVWDEDAWGSIEKGERTGWSIQGLAFRDEDAEAPNG